jgi:hypothetical protein
MTVAVSPYVHMTEEHCARLKGGCVRDCLCMLSNEGGFIACPPSARRVLRKVFEPVVVRSISLVEKRESLSGDICADCGSPNMVRAGSCLLCRDCGSTNGGCS